jgi:hypothetical protein
MFIQTVSFSDDSNRLATIEKLEESTINLSEKNEKG